MYKVCTGFLGKLADIMCPNSTTMKHIPTFTLLLAMGLGAFAQSMPYNPDSNGDDFVGVDDVLGVLGVYNTALIDSTLTCDYEGTELENLLAGLVAGELILDSLYVEYLLVDSQFSYTPGCPDPILVETVLNRSYMFTDFQSFENPSTLAISDGMSVLNYTREFSLQFNLESGVYELLLNDSEIGAFTPYWPTCVANSTLPFPGEFQLDENGIQVEWGAQYDFTIAWMTVSEEFRLIPFWHSAE